MKYALIDGEIYAKPRDPDVFLPLSRDEAQRITDLLNKDEKHDNQP